MADRAHAEALYQQARQHMQVGGLIQEALRNLNAAIAADPTFADAYDARSNFYVALGRADEAIADMQKCAELASTQGATTRDNSITGDLPIEVDDILKRYGL